MLRMTARCLISIESFGREKVNRDHHTNYKFRLMRRYQTANPILGESLIMPNETLQESYTVAPSDTVILHTVEVRPYSAIVNKPPIAMLSDSCGQLPA